MKSVIVDVPAHISSNDALALLMDGNERFSSGLRSIEAAFTVAKMQELAEDGQRPFAIILTCSDSRVPTEMIFDRGLGDLFVIRVAGNVISPMIMASVEYAASVLGVQLCVVMGHSGCGAVATAVRLENDSNGQVAKSLTPSLSVLLSAIQPAVREAKKIVKTNDHEECVREATHLNVQHSVHSLCEQSAALKELCHSGKLLIVGAIYDIHSGVVKFADEAATQVRTKTAAAQISRTRPMMASARTYMAKKRVSV